MEYGPFREKCWYLETLQNFAFLYFDFWPSTIAMLLAYTSGTIFKVKHVGYYSDSLTSEVLFVVAYIFAFFASMFVVHCFVTLVGFLFVKSEIQGLGNEKLLNNFQEGLIIAQKDSG